MVIDGSGKSPITRQELMEQLKQDIAEFYASFRRRYLALRRKHIKQIREFRRENSGNLDTGNTYVMVESPVNFIYSDESSAIVSHSW